MNKTLKTLITFMIVILISIASFYVYIATRDSITSYFQSLGITNVWLQVLIVVSSVLIIVSLLTMLLGRKVNVFSTLKDIFKT